MGTWPIGRTLWLSRNNNNGDEEESAGVCHLLSRLFLCINKEDHLRVVALESALNHSLDHVLERWPIFIIATQQALAKHRQSLRITKSSVISVRARPILEPECGYQ
mmetsp:Transcript_32144/g.39114  ORF Transcript_32144/g.39114 Transcript_32144/m.39114 type:complete len:106 (+) Transcript_32144:453-770(+)